MVLERLEDCRAAKASGKIAILNVIGMLCGKGAEARRPRLYPVHSPSLRR